MKQEMKAQAALRVALDLLHLPTQIRHAREAPLPDGITELLRIATGDRQAIRNAAQATKRPQEDITQAAAFFIEQILLAHDADSYRTLGVNPDADSSELRRNMTLIMKYLHPDLDKNAERAIFITRVTKAWNDLKTPRKRAEYDRRLQTQTRPTRKNSTKAPLPRKNSRARNYSAHTSKAPKRRSQTSHQTGLWAQFTRLLQKIPPS